MPRKFLLALPITLLFSGACFAQTVAFEGDVKGVSLVQAKVVELADKIDTSQKAMVTIRKIHRTMCLKDQRAMAQPEGQASR